MSIKKRVVLVSGGLDSWLVCHWAPRDAVKLFVDYGQPYAKLELQACREQYAETLKVVTMSGLSQGDEIYVPARNLMLASIACRYGNMILMGGMKDDNCVDKTEQAFEDMSIILSRHCKEAIVVVSPFWNINKADAVTMYLKDGGDKDMLLKTISCYRAGKNMCGDCEACFRWLVALRANGLKVPKPSERVIAVYLAKLHAYCKNRQWTTLRAIHTKETPVIEFDIDGTLTNEVEGFLNYITRTPKWQGIEVLKHYYKNKAYIILHSARREMDRSITERWLKRHRIPYHALLLEKTPSSIHFDDQWGGKIE